MDGLVRTRSIAMTSGSARYAPIIIVFLVCRQNLKNECTFNVTSHYFLCRLAKPSELPFSISSPSFFICNITRKP